MNNTRPIKSALDLLDKETREKYLEAKSYLTMWRKALFFSFVAAASAGRVSTCPPGSR